MINETYAWEVVGYSMCCAICICAMVFILCYYFLEKKTKNKIKITSKFRKVEPRFIPSDQIKSRHLEPMMHHKIKDRKLVNTKDHLHYKYNGNKIDNIIIDDVESHDE
jgi:hypothetical protein